MAFCNCFMISCCVCYLYFYYRFQFNSIFTFICISIIHLNNFIYEQSIPAHCHPPNHHLLTQNKANTTPHPHS